MNAIVADMVHDNQRKWNSFAHLLLMQQVVMVLANYPPPSSAMDTDLLYWHSCPRGLLTVQSAYELQASTTRSHCYLEPLWKLIWQWKGPERIKAFLQVVAHDCLMTDANRASRHLTEAPYHHSCPLELESVLHAVQNYPLATNVWRVLVKPSDRRNFFGAELIS